MPDEGTGILVKEEKAGTNNLVGILVGVIVVIVLIYILLRLL